MPHACYICWGYCDCIHGEIDEGDCDGCIECECDDNEEEDDVEAQ